MNEHCGISDDSGKREAIERRTGRLRWRAAKMAVLLGGFLYEGKKELDEDDKKIIAQTRKWFEEANEEYCQLSIEELEKYDPVTCAEISVILAALGFIEDELEKTEKNEAMKIAILKTVFEFFTKIASGEKEKYFLDKLINTHCEGYCMIKHLSGEI